MATLNPEILLAAHKDGLISKKLSKRELLYLNSSLLTANAIYWAIAASSDGLDSDQLTHRTGIAKNTLFQYLRWLKSQGLIAKISKDGVKGVYVLLPDTVA